MDTGGCARTYLAGPPQLDVPNEEEENTSCQRPHPVSSLDRLEQGPLNFITNHSSLVEQGEAVTGGQSLLQAVAVVHSRLLQKVKFAIGDWHNAMQLCLHAK